MKQKFCVILAVLCILLSFSACQDTQKPATDLEPEIISPAQEPDENPSPALVPTLSQRDQDWLEDIEFLRETYKTNHAAPFYLVSEEEFDWKLDQVAAKVSGLSDIEIACELKSIIAGMGDSHTKLFIDSLISAEFPFCVDSFHGKLYPTGYLEGYEQFAPCLLREIVAVNGVDTAFLRQKTAELNHPFNMWYSEMRFADDFSPEILDWAGCGYQEGYTLSILDENNEVKTVEAPVISAETWNEGTWGLPENCESLWCWRNGNWAEYVEGENGGCIHAAFSDMHAYESEPYQEFFESAGALIAEHPECRKLVIDLRNNGGGSVGALRHIRNCTAQLKAPSLEHTYVLTGGATVSGGVSSIAIFRRDLGAVLVGEPTGQFSSFFSISNPPVSFPHSQLFLQIGDGWYDGERIGDKYYDENGKLYVWENTILPDVYVHQNIEDIRQGKDSVLEWVLAQ